MTKLSELIKTITQKHGSLIDLDKNPEILMDIVTECRIHEQHDVAEPATKNPAPFGVPWMDSWAANWMLYQQPANPKSSSEVEFKAVVQQLTELKFRERLNEIKKFIIDQHGFVNETPDGGTPEPGTPPAGPSAIFADTPPDGGTPEPGVPPAPEPPGPGPDPGPDAGILHNNPWILYWFISINAPLILDMIDAHFTRRMNDLKQQVVK